MGFQYSTLQKSHYFPIGWGSFDVAILKEQARGGLAIFAALSWLDINKI